MDMSDLITGCVKAEELQPGTNYAARITTVDSRQFDDGTKGVIFLDHGCLRPTTNRARCSAGLGLEAQLVVGDVVASAT